jgi:hypothetical protein
MAYNPQMPQMPQMPQQGQQQQQYQNPAANWQRTYQNSQWFRPTQYQPNPYQQNPYQSQMQQVPQQQMPQQYQQQQMPQFTQQQINSFLNFMRSRPMPNFMGDPRYQAQQAEKPIYQPPAQTAARTYAPTVRYEGGAGGIGPMAGFGGRYTVGDATADAWVKGKVNELQIQRSKERGGSAGAKEADYQNFYNQYYAGAQ